MYDFGSEKETSIRGIITKSDTSSVNYMINTGIIITVNLLGRIKPGTYTGAPRKFISETGKETSHRDAVVGSCNRKINISREAVIAAQEDSKFPINNVSPGRWKKMLATERFIVFLNSFDEGYGVSYIAI